MTLLAKGAINVRAHSNTTHSNTTHATHTILTPPSHTILTPPPPPRADARAAYARR